MGSFAANRGNVNKGTGLKPGLWLFEEFMFSETVFGSASVSYQCDAHRMAKCDIDGSVGKPYELQISSPVVTDVRVFDDQGVSIDLKENDIIMLNAMVLDAFELIQSDVIDFEMGEL